jgi:hypothetical protein
MKSWRELVEDLLILDLRPAHEWDARILQLIREQVKKMQEVEDGYEDIEDGYDEN